MMMNGAASQHYSNNTQPQPIPLSQLPPLMGTPPSYGYQSSPHSHHHNQFRRRPGGQMPLQHADSRSFVSNSSGTTTNSGSNTSTGSSSIIQPLIQSRGFYGQQQIQHAPVLDLGNKQQCYVCGDGLIIEHSTQVACGHRLCPKCLNIPLSNGGLISTFDKCTICSPMAIFNGSNLRDAFNSETSSPIFGTSSSQPIKIGTLDNYNIWEPLPLTNQQRCNSSQNDSELFRPPQSLLNSSGSYPNVLQAKKSTPTPLNAIKSMYREKDNNNDKGLLKTVQKCICCDEKNDVIANCVDCNELLCAACVFAHSRVKLTREHKVQMLDEPANSGISISTASHSDSASIKCDSESPNSCTGNSITSLTSCPDHDLGYVAACLSCGGANLCVRCLQQHSGHQMKMILNENQALSGLKRLSAESRNIQKSMEDSLEGLKRMAEKIDAATQTAVGEMQSQIHHHISTLEDRRREMLERVNKIHYAKMSTLKTQKLMIADKLASLEQALAYSEELCQNTVNLSEQQLVDCYEKLIYLHADRFVPLIPTVNDSIRLKPVDPYLLVGMKSIGLVDSGLDPRTTCINGTRFKRATSGRPLVVNIQMKDINGDPVSKESREQGGEFVATLYGPLSNGQSMMQYAELIDRDNGVCSLMFTPKKVGQYRLNITYCQMPIAGCPTDVTVCSGRDYKDAQKHGQKFSFGKEGTKDGEFSRPWGICCDLKGRIIVADRSNHRIQIFDARGRFLSKFGSRGIRQGEFNRPAGICVNPANNIIIADKDNHRVQVFHEDGRFSHTFGTRGCSQGCFNYPWDVASNSNSEIAVTDTRNHRVQLFTASGTIIRICAVDVGIKRSPTSPRGICYLPDNDLVISDFNTHRLAVINKNNEIRFFGLEGVSAGYFHRPQGIAVDSDGLVLVCDSRSNRIQVLNIYDLTVVAVFGNDPKHLPKPDALSLTEASPDKIETSLFRHIEDDDFDRDPKAVDLLEHPMDITVSPEGLVYVVDFGNNCIRVY